MLHKLRRAMEPTSGKLEGTVEVDESFVGGDEPGVRGRLTRWILGTHQGAVSKELLDYYLAEFAFRYNRRYSRHRGLLFYRLAEQAMQTEPKPYVELLAPRASKARKRKVKAGRKKRAAGLVGKPVNVPRLQPKRPGGKLTKLTDSATAKRRFAVKGRRGL
jgi:carotenoid cleavage dioxygenase-like enzyme